MTALGKKGVQEMAKQNIVKTRYAKNAFEKAGFEVPFQGAHFNEIVVKTNKCVNEINKKLLEKGIIGGFNLGSVYPELKNHALIAVTELRTKEEIDALSCRNGGLQCIVKTNHLFLNYRKKAVLAIVYLN